MRPASITWFERLYLASLLVSAGNAAMLWEATTARLPPAFVISLQAITFAVLLALTLWVSRKGNNVAKWVIVVLFAFRVISFVYGLAVPMMLGLRVMTVLHTLLQTVAVALLFTRSARAWLNRNDAPPSTEAELRSTFD